MSETDSMRITTSADVISGFTADIENLEREIAVLQAKLAAVGAAPDGMSHREFGQFLSDVITAAGLVSHGKQCKALGQRLGDAVMRLKKAPQPAAQALECGNCFKGKSDMQHDCRKCGGTGGKVMRHITMWTVVRFPNGSWSTGGRPEDPAYSECEVFRVEAGDRDEAKKLAQAIRRQKRRAAERAAQEQKP